MFFFLENIESHNVTKLKHMSVILKFTNCILVITTQVQENPMHSYILEINVLAISEQKEKYKNYIHILYPNDPRVPEDFVLL